MARTEIPRSAWVAGSHLSDPTGTNLDATNDHIVKRAEPEHTVLRVTNTDDEAHTVTIKAGSYPLAIAAGQGDLTLSVAASGTEWIGPVESGRYLQNDGSLHIDIEAGHTGTVTAFEMPRSA